MTPRVPRPRPIRLRGFDYSSPGCYFITICTHDRECVLGDLRTESIVLTPIGEIVRRTWPEIPCHFPNVRLDEYVVMPNHLHGLLLIEDVVVGAQHPAPASGQVCCAPTRPP
jgi:REP element-mobilizing transposase RayT